MFKLWSEKNHEHIIRYPKVNEELDFAYSGKIIEKLVDDVIYDYESYREGEIDEYIRKEIDDLQQWKVGEYSFDCGDFTYYINIK